MRRYVEDAVTITIGPPGNQTTIHAGPARFSYEAPNAAASRAERRQLKRLFDNWKAPIGSACELTDDFGRKMLTTTRSMPWKLGNGTPVILVDGKVGGYLLTRIKVVLGKSKEGSG